MVVVLGIDPGTANTGYGVVFTRGRTMAALDGGVIETASSQPLERRLARIHGDVKALIAEHEPGRPGHRGALLRSQRPQRVRGRTGAWRGAAGRG